MSKPTIATLFSGGGIGLARLKSFCDVIWGVEYSPEIAEVYRANISSNIIVDKVQNVNPSRLERPDIFQVSPVCKEFSSAKVGGKESEEEISQAKTICNFLRVLTPNFFILENVKGYVKSLSFKMIVSELIQLGYYIDCEVQHTFDGLEIVSAPILNSADFGVPQTRERLILRASLLCELPELSERSQWVGWYEAIEDLIPELPQSEFAEWQLAKLDKGLFESSIVEGSNSSEGFAMSVRGVNAPAFTIKSSVYKSVTRAFLLPGINPETVTPLSEDQPAFTVVSSASKQASRAFIVDGKSNGNSERVTVKRSDEPIFTVTSSVVNQNPRAWLSQGRVVKMTARALARFQSIPDEYELPDNNKLACTIIGNGVPSLLLEKIVRGLLDQEQASLAA